ncbi:EHMT1 [Cordylochernes scorpioides]|uniref:EHMT1 n=1 Tax=Cordylochernes scorpioides TaxID=51811 RepID=A0ABY6LMT4_9ARAC|nr:EHMT1 [Cordylochernes scorpioides]
MGKLGFECFSSNEEVERVVDGYFNSLPDSLSGRNTNIGEMLDQGEDGMTSLHLAAREGDVEICKLLLDTAKLNVNIQDDGGWTPIVWASEHRHIDVIRLLLSRGADPTIRDNEENTALHWSSYSGSLEISHILLDCGCDLSAVNVHGDTPLAPVFVLTFPRMTDDTSPFNVSLEVAHPSFPEAIYPQSPVFSKKNINEVTKKAHVVVKFFKRSPLKNEILLNYMRQDNHISTSMCLILDCRTCWDSLLNMLERLISVKSAIKKALIDVNANVRLTDEDFDIMTQVISALKPFRAAVAAICRRDATLLTAEATVKFLLEELQAQSHSLSKNRQKSFQKRILEERCNKTSLVLQYLHNPQAQLEKKEDGQRL